MRRSADRRALGWSAGDGRQDRAGLRLAAAEGARRSGGRWFVRPDRHPRARLRVGARSRAPRRPPLRAAPRRGGAQRRRAGRPERAATALQGALSLWRGPPLANLAYEPFAQREIARLDDLRVWALEQLIEARLALGAHAEVVGQLETLIAEHPYRAPAGPAAGPLPLRPAGRRAAGLPGRTPPTGRGARHRAGRAPARARASHPGARPRVGGLSRARRRGWRGSGAWARRAAHGRGDLPAHRYRGLVGPMGGGSRRNGGGARDARRADRKHRAGPRRAGATPRGRVMPR